MPINVEIQDNHMSLRDAIAYEFYMDNLSNYMESWRQEHEEKREDIHVALGKLAVGAFTVADIFCATRDDIVNKEITEEANDTNA